MASSLAALLTKEMEGGEGEVSFIAACRSCYRGFAPSDTESGDAPSNAFTASSALPPTDSSTIATCQTKGVPTCTLYVATQARTVSRSKSLNMECKVE